VLCPDRIISGNMIDSSHIPIVRCSTSLRNKGPCGSYAASIEEIEPALFDEVFHLNVLGPIVAVQTVIPMMRAQGGGSIVNINSGTAFMTVPQYSVYSASKRALLGFSLTARAELQKHRIVVSEIYSFITATKFGKNRRWGIQPAAGRPPIV
jgi:short-subunit dehydrogenase